MGLTETLQIIPAAVVGLTVHEFAHAYTAWCLGDNTARADGRVSLNPLRHIDWLGFFLIVIAGFGWAKPVRFNAENLRKPHRDEILIAVAGPLSNLLLALFFLLLGRALFFLDFSHTTQIGILLVNLLVTSGVINLGLFVFNLMPIPPLDGSHLYLPFIKSIHPELMQRVYQYGTFFLMIIILAENFLHVNVLHLSQIIRYITSFFLHMLQFV